MRACACVRSWQVCDVSSLSSIKALVDDLQAAHQATGVHVLVNNAGVMVRHGCGRNGDSRTPS